MKKDIEFLLKHLRKEQIAARLGVSTRTLDRWRNGEVEAPKAKRLRVERMATQMKAKRQRLEQMVDQMREQANASV